MARTKKRLTSGALATALLTGVLTFTGASPARAATFEPEDSEQLLSAVSEANTNGADDTIRLGGRTFVLTEQLELTRDQGAAGRTTVTIQGPGTLQVQEGSIVRALEVRGAGNDLTVNVLEVTISGGTQQRGGGIFVSNADLLVNHSLITGNAAYSDGGGIASVGIGSTRVYSSTVSGNRAPSGGGISSETTFAIRSSTVTDNIGDGVRQNSPSAGGQSLTQFMNIFGSIVYGNRGREGRGVSDCDGPGNWGNAQYNVYGSSCSFLFVEDTFGVSDNSNDDPGLGDLEDNGGTTRTHAINHYSTAFDSVPAGTITYCRPSDQRGILRPQFDRCDAGAFELDRIVQTTIPTKGSDSNDGICDEVDCSLREALAYAHTIGGGQTIPLAGRTYSLTLGQLSVDTDIVFEGPGTIRRAPRASHFRLLGVAGMRTVTIDRVTLSGGRAPDGTGNARGQAGGAISNAGTLIVTDSTLSGNRAGDGGSGSAIAGAGGNGGAIVNGGVLIVTNSTLSGNRAGDGGVGTVLAGEGGSGGAIDNGGSGMLTIYNSTITDNAAGTGFPDGTGGGMRNGLFFSSAEIHSSILAANTASVDPDCSGIVNGESSFNVLSAAGCGMVSMVNENQVVDSDLGLGPLADNGGPTKTHALSEGSVLIDRGANLLALPFDQRGPGYPRSFAESDVGSYERQRGGGDDYGDAPDSYGTTLEADGARHTAVGPYFGEARDPDLDAQAPLDGTGDDASGEVDDEDGVVFGDELTAGQSAEVDLTVAREPFVDAWIDFDGSGTFDPDEQIFASLEVQSSAVLSFDVPADAATGQTYARFRASPAGGLGPTGAADSGEVEDHTVTIQAREPELTVTVEGEGTVTSAPDGIVCPEDCAHSYENGTEVVLTATPDEGWRLEVWSGDCSGEADCALTMDGDRSATATFTQVSEIEETPDASEPGSSPQAPESTPAPTDSSPAPTGETPGEETPGEKTPTDANATEGTTSVESSAEGALASPAPITTSPTDEAASTGKPPGPVQTATAIQTTDDFDTRSALSVAGLILVSLAFLGSALMALWTRRDSNASRDSVS